MTSAPRFTTDYTIDDYQHWEGDWQLIEGIAVSMSPSPFGKHQRIVMKLVFQFINQLENQNADCRVYAGLDWIVSDETVVRPDVMVVCGEQPDKHLEKNPVIAVEVLSESTMRVDLTAKCRIYQTARVPNYLIADPKTHSVEVMKLVDNEYQAETFAEGRSFSLVHDNWTVKINVNTLFN